MRVAVRVSLRVRVRNKGECKGMGNREDLHEDKGDGERKIEDERMMHATNSRLGVHPFCF